MLAASTLGQAARSRQQAASTVQLGPSARHAGASSVNAWLGRTDPSCSLTLQHLMWHALGPLRSHLLSVWHGLAMDWLGFRPNWLTQFWHDGTRAARCCWSRWVRSHPPRTLLQAHRAYKQTSSERDRTDRVECMRVLCACERACECALCVVIVFCARLCAAHSIMRGRKLFYHQ